MWLPVEELNVQASLLVSVSKRRFKRAVKRNRVKRQVREAYRLNKHILLDTVTRRQLHLVMGFIWLGNELCSTQEVERRVVNLLQRLSERLDA